MVLALALLAIVAFGWFVGKAFRYAETHPDHSVLDGADFVRYRELQFAAKDPSVIDVTPEGSTNTTPPKSLSHRGGE
jgi:hypothetical protein